MDVLDQINLIIEPYTYGKFDLLDRIDQITLEVTKEKEIILKN